MSENLDIVVRTIGADKAADDINKIGTSLDSLKGILAGLGLALTTQQVLAMGESYSLVVEKLNMYSKSQAEANAKMQELFDIAQVTRQSLEGTAAVYGALSKATVGLSLSTKDVLDLTATVSQGMTVARKPVEEVTGIFKQLQLSISSGMAPGRAFMMLMREFPELGNAIAAGLGKSSGELITLGRSGQIGMAEIVKGLQAAGLETSSLQQKFQKSSVTMSEAWTTVRNALLKYIGEQDQASGASAKVTEAIAALGRNINIVMPLVQGLTAAMVVFGLATSGSSVLGGITALWSLLARNPLVSVAAAVIGLGVAFRGMGNNIQLTSNGSITAMGALVGSFNIVVGGARNLLGVISNVFNSLNTSYPIATKVAVGVGGLALAFGVLTGAAGALSLVLGPLWALFASGTAALLRMVAPIAGFVLGFAAMVAAIYAVAAAITLITDHLGLTTGAFDRLNAKIADTASKAKDQLEKSLQDATKALKDAGDGAAAAAVNLNQANTSMDAAGNAAAAASQKYHQSADAFKEVHDAAGAASDAIKSLGESYLNGASDADKLAERVKASSEAIQAAMKAEIAAYDSATDAVKRYVDMSGMSVDAAKKKVESDEAWTKADQEAAKAADEAAAAIERENKAAHDAVVAFNAARAAMTAWKNSTTTFNIGSVSPLAAALGDLRGQIATLTAQADLAAAMETLGQTSPNGSSQSLRDQLALLTAKLAVLSNLANTPGTFPEGASPAYGVRDTLNGLGIPYTKGFATGGSFMVGGSGGTDSQHVSFFASPDEQVTITTPAQRRAAARGVGGIIVNMHVHGVTDVRGFNRNLGQIGARTRAELSRRT